MFIQEGQIYTLVDPASQEIHQKSERLPNFIEIVQLDYGAYLNEVLAHYKIYTSDDGKYWDKIPGIRISETTIENRYRLPYEPPMSRLEEVS